MLTENQNNNPAKGAIIGGFVGNIFWPGLGGIIAGGLLGGYFGAKIADNEKNPDQVTKH